MKIFSVVICTVILSGCKQEPSWANAPELYVCSEEQMQRVEKETAFAIALDSGKDSKNFDKYWYGAAIMRNCTLKGDDNEQS